MAKDFPKTACFVIQNLTSEVKLTAFTLAIIRRLAANKAHQSKIAETFLLTLIGFIKSFYEI